MLTHPTSERLLALVLAGMAKALDEQRENRSAEGLTKPDTKYIAWCPAQSFERTQPSDSSMFG